MTLELSIIISTPGREDRVRRLLSSLLAQREGITAEIILVNTGSRRRLEIVFEEFETSPWDVHHVVLETKSVGKARQAGAGRADGEILLFLDDDMEAKPGLLRAHLDAHVRHPGGAFVGQNEWAADSVETQFEHWCTHRSVSAQCAGADAKLYPLEINPSNWSISRSWFASDGFDENIEYAGLETEALVWKLMTKGLSLRFAMDARAITRQRDSLESLVQRSYRRGRAMRALLAEFPGEIGTIKTQMLVARRTRPRWLMTVRGWIGLTDGPAEWNARVGHAICCGLDNKGLPEDVLGRGYPSGN